MLSCTAEEVGGLKAWLPFLLACASVARLTYTHSSTEQGSVCGAMQVSMCVQHVCIYACVCCCNFVSELSQ